MENPTLGPNRLLTNVSCNSGLEIALERQKIYAHERIIVDKKLKIFMRNENFKLKVNGGNGYEQFEVDRDSARQIDVKK